MEVIHDTGRGIIVDRLDIPLDIATSPLLQALSDYCRDSVWTYLPDGAFPNHRAAKDEFERLVEEIIKEVPRNKLVELAKTDKMYIGGFGGGPGPGPKDPETLESRFLATRQIEMATGAAQGELNDRALSKPKPTDRVYQAVPGLFKRQSTRDFLLPLTGEMVKDGTGQSDRVFVDGDNAYFPHPALRHNRELIARLCSLAEAGHPVSVAIDPYRMLPSGSVPGVVLADYWWGMKLKRKDLDDIRKIDNARHGRPPEKNQQNMFQLLFTDFRWSVKGVEKTIEVQESIPGESPVNRSEKYILNRYVHSIRNTKVKSFIHLDGAMKAFPKEGYFATINDPEAEQGKERYRKMFRVDGNIPDEEWAPLISQFFRANELIIEYFGEIVDERL